MARLKGAKRQNNQLQLAFGEGMTSEARSQSSEGTEASVAKCSAESLAPDEQWMERICQRENLWQALKRVKRNGGSPGIDGMTVDELPGYLKQHWLESGVVSDFPRTRNMKIMLRRVLRAVLEDKDPGDLSALAKPEAGGAHCGQSRSAVKSRVGVNRTSVEPDRAVLRKLGLALFEVRGEALAGFGAGETEHFERGRRRIKQRPVDAQPVVERVLRPADCALRTVRKILRCLQCDALQIGILNTERHEPDPLGFFTRQRLARQKVIFRLARARTAAAR